MTFVACPPAEEGRTTSAELVRGYGVSAILSTATQPALGPRATSGRQFGGIEGVRELMDAPETLWPALDRVTVTWPADLDERSTCDGEMDMLLASFVPSKGCGPKLAQTSSTEPSLRRRAGLLADA